MDRARQSSSGWPTMTCGCLDTRKTGGLIPLKLKESMSWSTVISTDAWVDVQKGRTLWITPGNVARVARSDVTRQQVPAALKVTFDNGDWNRESVTVPHQPFADVFHPEMQTEAAATTSSAFV